MMACTKLSGLSPEIVETTLVASWFRFLRVASRISVLIDTGMKPKVAFLLNKKINKLRKGIIVGFQLEKIQRRRYEQKLNENDQYAMQSRENKTRSHYLCLLPLISHQKLFISSFHLNQFLKMHFMA